jgi:hypothetical protein
MVIPVSIGAWGQITRSPSQNAMFQTDPSLRYPVSSGEEHVVESRTAGLEAVVRQAHCGDVLEAR